MAQIKQFKEGPVIDYMARDYDSLLGAMRELIPYKLPEWTDYQSEADFGNVLLELFAHMGDILSYYQDRIANESFLGTARERASIIRHLRLIGYWLSTPAPASAYLDMEVAGDSTERVTIRKGDAFATKSKEDQPSMRFEYTGDTPLEIDFGTITAADEKKVFKGIPVEEGRYAFDEVIGESDGTPNQRFQLVHSPLILRSRGLGKGLRKDITLVIELGQTKTEWALQETLAFSGQDQLHYVIEIDDMDRAEVLFGDGVFGGIPPRGALIKTTYRVGGGRAGNVPPGAIDTIVDAPQLSLIGAEIANPGAATGGADRETIEHAVKHAPALFRSYKRAVTAQDYMALARGVAGVGKVRAEKGDWNTVNLYVAPQGGGYVSDTLKKDLLLYFEDKRPITTVVEIKDVTYIPVFISATVGISGFYSESDIRERVMEGMQKILSFDTVDFAQTLYISKFYEAMEAVEGVEHVTVTEFRREDTATADHLQSGRIIMKENEIPMIPTAADHAAYAEGIKLTVVLRSS